MASATLRELVGSCAVDEEVAGRVPMAEGALFVRLCERVTTRRKLILVVITDIDLLICGVTGRAVLAWPLAEVDSIVCGEATAADDGSTVPQALLRQKDGADDLVLNFVADGRNQGKCQYLQRFIDVLTTAVRLLDHGRKLTVTTVNGPVQPLARPSVRRASTPSPGLSAKAAALTESPTGAPHWFVIRHQASGLTLTTLSDGRVVFASSAPAIWRQIPHERKPGAYHLAQEPGGFLSVRHIPWQTGSFHGLGVGAKNADVMWVLDERDVLWELGTSKAVRPLGGVMPVEGVFPEVTTQVREADPVALEFVEIGVPPSELIREQEAELHRRRELLEESQRDADETDRRRGTQEKEQLALAFEEQQREEEALLEMKRHHEEKRRALDRLRASLESDADALRAEEQQLLHTSQRKMQQSAHRRGSESTAETASSLPASQPTLLRSLSPGSAASSSKPPPPCNPPSLINAVAYRDSHPSRPSSLATNANAKPSAWKPAPSDSGERSAFNGTVPVAGFPSTDGDDESTTEDDGPRPYDADQSKASAPPPPPLEPAGISLQSRETGRSRPAAPPSEASHFRGDASYDGPQSRKHGGSGPSAPPSDASRVRGDGSAANGQGEPRSRKFRESKPSAPPSDASRVRGDAGAANGQGEPRSRRSTDSKPSAPPSDAPGVRGGGSSSPAASGPQSRKFGGSKPSAPPSDASRVRRGSSAGSGSGGDGGAPDRCSSVGGGCDARGLAALIAGYREFFEKHDPARVSVSEKLAHMTAENPRAAIVARGKLAEKYPNAPGDDSAFVLTAHSPSSSSGVRAGSRRPSPSPSTGAKDEPEPRENAAIDGGQLNAVRGDLLEMKRLIARNSASSTGKSANTAEEARENAAKPGENRAEAGKKLSSDDTERSASSGKAAGKPGEGGKKLSRDDIERSKYFATALRGAEAFPLVENLRWRERSENSAPAAAASFRAEQSAPWEGRGPPASSSPRGGYHAGDGGYLAENAFRQPVQGGAFDPPHYPSPPVHQPAPVAGNKYLCPQGTPPASYGAGFLAEPVVAARGAPPSFFDARRAMPYAAARPSMSTAELSRSITPSRLGNSPNFTVLSDRTVVDAKV